MVKSRSKRGKGSVKAMEDPKPFCKLVTKKFLEEHLEEYKEWVREPRYVCKKCGMVARREKDLYFGPYTSSGSVRETLRFLLKVFPIRTCKDSVFK